MAKIQKRQYYFDSEKYKYVKSETIFDDNEDVDIDAGNILLLNIYEDPSTSTGGSVYYAATFLCEYFLSIKMLFKDMCIIELGAGTGLCGILLYHLQAKQVILTDKNVELLIKNRKLQGQENEVDKKILIEHYNWSMPREIPTNFPNEVDYIIGSDVVYDATTPCSFLSAVYYLCKYKYKAKPPKVLVAHQPRLTGVDDLFFEKVHEYNFSLKEIKPVNGNLMAKIFELTYDPSLSRYRRPCKVM